MKLRTVFLTFLLLFSAVCSHGRHRILISTDIGGTDPDDNQSMIHLLMYANEFDIEGLVSSPSYGDGSKEEILRMIDMYEEDLPSLKAGLSATYGSERGNYPSPDELRAITRQGRKGMPSLRGYGEPTEGSQMIIDCARREDSRPLWVLVWGGLEDVAQALHDAPDIAGKIRVNWIGGPNKKWGVNAYNYIVENFPDLWFIENNASYRGFIGSPNDNSLYGSGMWEREMKGAGKLGDDFINYYKGVAKMGDTPTLLYLMSGDADNPDSEHWGGRFEPMHLTPKYIITGDLTPRDSVACYSILDWRISGPSIDIAPDSACITLEIDKQKWPGYYIGDGVYSVRYCPKAPAILPYTISSEIPGFETRQGTLAVANRWPGTEIAARSEVITPAHVEVGRNGIWFTDLQDYSTTWQGTATTSRWRDEVMKDWSTRFGWLKNKK